jgi:hypothetical protein
MNRRQQLEQAHAELLWRHYANNPADFFRDCVYVPSGEKFGGTEGRTNFELFDYQLDTLTTIRDNRYVIVLKARQLGLTTLMMAYAFWMLLFRPGSNIVLVSRSQNAANSALEIMDFMYNFLPEWAKNRGPRVESDAATHHSYKFNNGMVSKITSYAATKTVAAGQTATLVLWDEAALAEYQEDAFRTLLPTTDAGGSMVIFSTARGGYNQFARVYRDAERNESQFVPIFHPWHASRFMNPKADVNEVDDSLYELKKRDMSNEPWRFYAEYPSSSEEAFRQSGRARFTNLPDVDQFEPFPYKGRILTNETGHIELRAEAEGPLQWSDHALLGTPPGCRAVISVDPSIGMGGDYTVITAGWVNYDGIPVRAAVWRSNEFEAQEVAEQAFMLGRYFIDNTGKDALVVVERQGGYGETTVHLLRQMGYRNLYVHRYTGHRKYKQDTSFGFPMTMTRRPLVIDALAGWLDFDGGAVMVGIDHDLRRELGAFVVRSDGKVAADDGQYDDLVMSAAIFVYVAQEHLPKATQEPIDEDNKVMFNVNHIWEEAESMWRRQETASRREMRDWRRLAWR